MIRNCKSLQSLFSGKGPLVSAWARQIHNTPVFLAVDKAQLSKLRKKTGFPFINCKKALEKFDNDFDKAEAWIREEAQKEGWAKASKLQGRPMSQGLVAIQMHQASAAMVEVNCETDFVARNDKFHHLVNSITAACLEAGEASGQSKISFDRESLGKIEVESSSTVAETVVMAIGNIGENMIARRGLFLRAGDAAKIASYVHVSGNASKTNSKCVVGKYGALLTYKHLGAPPPADTADSAPRGHIGRQLCQHVVGMNPSTIGDMTTSDSSDDGSSSDSDGSGSDSDEEKRKDRENVMIHQEFLLDASLTVSDVLKENKMEILDFARYECGEDIESVS